MTSVVSLQISFLNKRLISLCLPLAHCLPYFKKACVCQYVVLFFLDVTDVSVLHWHNRVPTAEEEAAALTIQAAWRGTYMRQIINGRRPGQDFFPCGEKQDLQLY